MKKTIAIIAALGFSTAANALPTYDAETCRALNHIKNEIYESGVEEAGGNLRHSRLEYLRTLSQEFAIQATGQTSVSFVLLVGNLAEASYKLGRLSGGVDENGYYKMRLDKMLEQACQ